jgi:hypothetical protein
MPENIDLPTFTATLNELNGSATESQQQASTHQHQSAVVCLSGSGDCRG